MEAVIKGNVKVANFPFLKEIQDFDFSFQPSIDKKKIMDFMTLRFLENSENIIFCGSPGVGKTNLAVSIGIEAAKQRYCVYFITFQDLISQLKKAYDENRLETRIKWFCRYKLLIIDELGYQKMDTASANLFFNLIAKRYEKSSTINYIESRTDDNSALFVSLNKPHNRLTESGVELRLREMGKRLGVEKVHPHKFRRTMATRAIEKGMPIEQVQKILGHEQIDTTLRYAMVNQNNVKLAHRKYIS